MNADEFRKAMHELTEFIIDYKEHTEKHIRVSPEVEPGFLLPLIPANAPKKGEKWDNIMNDFTDLIMPGLTHWQHPQFHAYFPSGNSYPSILGDLLSSGLGVIGFSWSSSPSCTELETIVMNWLGKMSGLDQSFLPFLNDMSYERQKNDIEHTGGGVILGSASECVLVSMLAARSLAIENFKKRYNNIQEDGHILTKLVAYTSLLAHSCVEKNAKIALVQIRLLEPDQKTYALRGKILKEAIEKDIQDGLQPFFVCGTFGTTGCCSFDEMVEIGKICRKNNIYLHIDAAYAGNALICDEFRYLMPGISDWGIALSRRFKALKLWFTIRSYGIDGLQKYIRNHVRLALYFEKLVLSDERFEIFGKVTLGLVCFRLKGPNKLNADLVENLNTSGLIHLTAALINNKQVIRFCVTSEKSNVSDIKKSWNLIKQSAETVLRKAKRKVLIKLPYVSAIVRRFKFQSNPLIIYEINVL